jgi:hypothetical protein
VLSGLTMCAPVAALARPRPTPTPTATPTPPPEDPAVTAIARREFVAWQAGVVTKSHYSSRTQGLYPAKIDDTSKALSHFGYLTGVEWVGPLAISDGPPGEKGYVYRMNCVEGSVYEYLTIGADGKIDGIVFRDKLPTP